MAQSLEDIKAELEAPTHRIVNGERVDLTAEEIEATLDMWAENERTKQLDEEANGWIRNRQTEYPWFTRLHTRITRWWRYSYRFTSSKTSSKRQVP
jgi:hypothetical protein